MIITWEQMATMLADRLSNHAVCNSHTEQNAQPGNCPFCLDRLVYRMFCDKKKALSR